MNHKAASLSMIVLFALLFSSCSRAPAPAPTPLPVPTATGTPRPAPTATALPTPTATQAAIPLPVLTVGGQPFKFIGDMVTPYFFNDQWTEQMDDDLIRSAHDHGVTAFYLMLPLIEPELGVFDQAMLHKIDHFLATAAKYNLYAMIPFIHPYELSLSSSSDNPYFSVNGIDALVNDPKFAQAYQNRIRTLIGRTNSVNGRIYRDDPTILCWIIAEEPIDPPWNYPAGQAPVISIPQFRDWLDASAKNIKSLDPNHLVAVDATFWAIQGGDAGKWAQALDFPSYDLVLSEDADMRPLNKAWPGSDWSNIQVLLGLRKPIVMAVDFSSGSWNSQPTVCKDIAWQAPSLNRAISLYFEAGLSGVNLYSWTSQRFAARSDIPFLDSCSIYTASSQPIVQMLTGLVGRYDLNRLADTPQQFVKVEAAALTAAGGPASAAGPAWTSLGLADLEITSVAVDPADPAIVYASQMGPSDTGVYKTLDNGANWGKMNNGLQNPDVRNLTFDTSSPAVLYAGSNNSVYKTTDGGENWTSSNIGMTETKIGSLAIDPANPATLYAGTYGGIFKSTDGGTTWRSIKTGLTAIWVYALAVDPKNPSTLYAGTYHGVYKSTDGGERWSAAWNGLTSWVYSLVIDPTSAATLYAGTDDGVFKSTDGAAHWTGMNNGLTDPDVQALVMDPASPATLYAGTFAGVFKTTDGGGSWSAYGNGLEKVKVFALAFDPASPATLYAGTSAGVFVTK